ncbi:ribosome-inactivating family protein [Streptomyces griseorubiginosus]|uniref:ribosome-inactivating family protein n=1 Tax=Streptomyces griseorubiginosus TaxID=67304 RepID=UPI00215A9C44|nr:ribosome-inactivating family protein [Streptomyces griseorubiginosus]
MPTSVLIAASLWFLLGILVFFAMHKDTETSAPTAADQATGNAETVVGKKHLDFPQVRWNINRGSGAYLTMLDKLRNLAETLANGRVMSDVDTEVNLAGTASTEGRSFADIVISSGNRTPRVHALVRLSDFRVVRFISSDTPHDFVLNLASDVPGKADADDDWFLGKEGHDTLARVANRSLTAFDLSQAGLENSLRDLGIRGTDRTAQARGILRYVIAITEASRSRPIADRIANGLDQREMSSSPHSRSA